MSTRAQVGFYEDERKDVRNFDYLIYVHSDGYPEGILPLVLPYVKEFLKNRGYDAEYLAARTLQHLMNDYDNALKELKEYDAYRSYRFLGFGISNQFHGDIEYYYAVYPDRLEVYAVLYDYDNHDLKFKLLDTYDFDTLLEGGYDDVIVNEDYEEDDEC